MLQALTFLSLLLITVASKDKLKVEVLSAGGSLHDEVVSLAADGVHHYIVGRFNADDDSGSQQETISVAKVENNLTDWEGIHGHLNCRKEGMGQMHQCTQILDNQELFMAPITGLVAAAGNAILSGCYHTFFNGPRNRCAAVVSPGKWQVLALSETCANMQGGMALQNGKVLVAGLFHNRVDFLQVDDRRGRNASFDQPLAADGLGSFLLQMDPRTGKIESVRKGIAVGPLFIAAGPTKQQESSVYILSRLFKPDGLVDASNCPRERSKGNYQSSGVVLTPHGFFGEGLFFGSDDVFEPTGMVVDQNDPTVVFIIGYFKGVLTLSNMHKITSAQRIDQSKKSIDGILIKVVYDNKTMPTIAWVLRIGGSGEDKALGVVAKDEGIYVTGTFEFAMKVDGWVTHQDEAGNPRLLKKNFSIETIKSRGKLDVFVMKVLSAEMDIKWISSAGGSQDDFASTIDMGSGGGVHVGGRYEGVAYFPDNNVITSQGSYDAFVATYMEVDASAEEDVDLPETSSTDMWRLSCMIFLGIVSILVIAMIVFIVHRRLQKRKRETREKKVLEQRSEQLIGEKLNVRVTTEPMNHKPCDDDD